LIVKGLDFTSSPSVKKPITCAICHLLGNELRILEIKRLEDFRAFEVEISEPGEWMAGIDFPFGQSRTLIGNLGWSDCWEEYVEMVSLYSKQAFVDLLESYKKYRRTGDKEHRRRIDELAKSISPQKLYGVPVGKMFYEGAKRLLRSPASIVPFRVADPQRVIMESYPALVARRVIGKEAYKHDQVSRQTGEHEDARTRIVAALMSGLVTADYGINVRIDSQYDALVTDASGDMLDAMLCALQAAWGYQNRDRDYGVPAGVDRAEGWIVDPLFVSADLSPQQRRRK
jgi:hypothetical protein